jgi:hypothetical protein
MHIYTYIHIHIHTYTYTYTYTYIYTYIHTYIHIYISQMEEMGHGYGCTSAYLVGLFFSFILSTLYRVQKDLDDPFLGSAQDDIRYFVFRSCILSTLYRCRKIVVSPILGLFKLHTRSLLALSTLRSGRCLVAPSSSLPPSHSLTHSNYAPRTRTRTRTQVEHVAGGIECAWETWAIGPSSSCHKFHELALGCHVSVPKP